MAAIELTALLAAIRQCVTILEPGEVLAVRVPGTLSDSDHGRLRNHAEAIRQAHGVTVLFLPGEEFARIKVAGSDDAFRPLKDHIRQHGGTGPASVQKALGGGV